ncbi:GTPase HflX [Desulfofustis limnaeus]|jgi:GTP-binding protein HflX|uniref:GTPase HflX n=1 Tax=Desulfofustis limnaeus TaxID=2740163 RepID=A0ABM7W781_9BACT|nr:GTPase HflX [Desulfofustis limnaeus]MDX9896911.1 GTPase HflX [Desulfofustis sp.]BDD86825.1 GTPase HflX [Desulfofustis limnaeus]
MARSLCELSHELNRQIGLLIHRSGKIEAVIVGDYGSLLIPALPPQRATGGRLRGLRLVHTHPGGEDLTDDDLMDLVFLRLDLIAVLKIARDGLPERLYAAHLLPSGEEGRAWQFLDPVHPAAQQVSFTGLVEALEQEFSRRQRTAEVDQGRDRAILISVSTEPRDQAEASLAELTELARSDDIIVLDRVLQRRSRINPRYILGKGRLSDIVIRALRLDANLLLFNQELNPSQIRSITDFTDLRVIDRTQLILDIFAHRARSREGKLQVEMAQLKYLLPRLSSRDDALSRLTGGIGARGPGETKLEIDRRRINDRLARLANELKEVGSERYRRRARRRKKDLPVLSLVGYTNAGKSTLLNTLTDSAIVAEDKLFATLDPTSRRLRFPEEMEVIITDTVGFIDNLPEDLLLAFKATLEELEEADLLLHVIDYSNPAYRHQMHVVQRLLQELELDNLPILAVFNKLDRVQMSAERWRQIEAEGVGVSALDQATLSPLLERAQQLMKKALATRDQGCR